MLRKSLSKRANRAIYHAGSTHTPKINFSSFMMRGGVRL